MAQFFIVKRPGASRHLVFRTRFTTTGFAFVAEEADQPDKFESLEVARDWAHFSGLTDFDIETIEHEPPKYERVMWGNSKVPETPLQPFEYLPGRASLRQPRLLGMPEIYRRLGDIQKQLELWSTHQPRIEMEVGRYRPNETDETDETDKEGTL